MQSLTDQAARVEPVTRTADLVDRIREDIASNRFPPGQRVTEMGLAEAYDTSRTPVREALRALAQEALLEYAPNVGYRVSRLRLQDLDDLYAVRVAVERRGVARLAGGLGDLTVVARLLKVWDGPVASGPSARLVFLDEAFHESLATAAGGSVLAQTLRTINRRIHALRMREFVDEERVARTYDQHAGVLRAIRDRDPELAVALMTSHILEGQRFVRANALALDLVDLDADGALEGGRDAS